MDKYMTLKEVVEGFVNFAYGDILFENEVSRFNISFEDSSFLKNKEFNFFSNSLQDILNNVPNCEIPTVVIHDTELFFRLLTNVINAQIDLNDLYDNSAAKSMVARRVMRRLWLRMGVEELDNIELFLEKQLAFIENRELDKPKYLLNLYLIYKVSALHFLLYEVHLPFEPQEYNKLAHHFLL